MEVLDSRPRPPVPSPCGPLSDHGCLPACLVHFDSSQVIHPSQPTTPRATQKANFGSLRFLSHRIYSDQRWSRSTGDINTTPLHHILRLYLPWTSITEFLVPLQNDPGTSFQTQELYTRAPPPILLREAPATHACTLGCLASSPPRQRSYNLPLPASLSHLTSPHHLPPRIAALHNIHDIPTCTHTCTRTPPPNKNLCRYPGSDPTQNPVLFQFHARRLPTPRHTSFERRPPRATVAPRTSHLALSPSNVRGPNSRTPEGDGELGNVALSQSAPSFV